MRWQRFKQGSPLAPDRQGLREYRNVDSGPRPHKLQFRNAFTCWRHLSQLGQIRAESLMDHDTWTRKALEIREALTGRSRQDRIQLFQNLPETVRKKALISPYILGRDGQVEALKSDADTILIMAGRGWGKNFLGTHWILDRIEGGHEATAGVAETAGDVRDDMVDPPREGDGLVDNGRKRELNPNHKISQSRVELKAPHGSARIQLYSGDSPDSLRGFSGSALWCDELAKMRYQDQVIDQANLSLREGDSQMLITTTPRPTETIRELVKADHVHVIRGSSWENEDNLDDRFIRQLNKIENTRLGRQEIEAEILEANGDLWSHEDIQHVLPEHVPELTRVVIGLDPSVNDKEGDEAGIVVCGLGEDDTAYVLEDLSGQYTTSQWGAIVAALYHGSLERIQDYLSDLSPIKDLSQRDYPWPPADKIEAERNQGGALVTNQIKSHDKQIAVNGVHVSRSKHARAEPIHSLAQSGSIKHVGKHTELEDQMVSFLQDEDSPDRVDAMVHALKELLLPDEQPAMTSDPVIPLD